MDLMNNIHVLRAISPVSVADNTAQVSQIIDRRGYGSLTFAIATGSIADADATFTVLVEHGDNSGLSDAAAVPDSELIGTEVLAGFQFDDDNETRKVAYLPGLPAAAKRGGGIDPHDTGAFVYQLGTAPSLVDSSTTGRCCVSAP